MYTHLQYIQPLNSLIGHFLICSKAMTYTQSVFIYTLTVLLFNWNTVVSVRII